MKTLKIRKLAVGMVLKEISLAKNNLISLNEFYELYAGDKTMLEVADIFSEYEKQKSKKMLKDFDDLLINVHELLAGNKAIREKYQGRFHHVLIDEFQDTTPVQLELIKLLSNHKSDTSFWICGDDWQSIFAFTGASVGNIINFKSMFPTAEEIILDLNYRSSKKILTACQRLISHNRRKIEKELKTENPAGDDIVIMESANEEEEAVLLVHEINDLVQRKEMKHTDIAILYRANFQSRIIEETFSQRKIPYQIENGQNFYDRYEVRCLLDYLRVINNPLSESGDEALVNIFNIPNRYISRKFVGELEQICREKECHLYEGLKGLRIKLPYIRNNIKGMIGFLNPLMENRDSLQPAELIAILREHLDYDSFITEDDVPSPDDLKILNVNQLQMAAVKFSSIDEFLTYTETFEDQAISNNKDGVRLMTIHKAKGLEFPVVFVIGLVDGVMPTKKGDIEEERRICFVALSRAMHHLYLSWSRSYLNQPAKQSTFLTEAISA
jgi:DNA helicase-2/ATP-dependent DNA helicase PcrA